MVVHWYCITLLLTLQILRLFYHLFSWLLLLLLLRFIHSILVWFNGCLLFPFQTWIGWEMQPSMSRPPVAYYYKISNALYKTNECSRSQTIIHCDASWNHFHHIMTMKYELQPSSAVSVPHSECLCLGSETVFWWLMLETLTVTDRLSGWSLSKLEVLLCHHGSN